MRELYMRTGQGFLLVYSIDNSYGFSHLTTLRQCLLDAKNTDDVPIVLVGNKCDLEKKREVTKDEGAKLALRWGCPFMEISALTPVNISDAFYELVRLIQAQNGKISDEVDMCIKAQLCRGIFHYKLFP